MDYVILGFLIMKCLSQYDILQALKKKISPFYKPSLGSIQNALKNLEKKGLVKKETVKENGRTKHLYHITKEGEAYFFQWMSEVPNENKLESQVAVKLFFMGLLDKKERIQMIEQIIYHLDQVLENHREEKNMHQGKNFEGEIYQIAKYQLLSLDLGLFHYENTRNWFSDLLKEERKEDGRENFKV